MAIATEDTQPAPNGNPMPTDRAAHKRIDKLEADMHGAAGTNGVGVKPALAVLTSKVDGNAEVLKVLVAKTDKVIAQLGTPRWAWGFIAALASFVVVILGVAVWKRFGMG